MNDSSIAAAAAEQIARVALDHYNNILPNKGKPNKDSEWTVYAAIVATSAAATAVSTSSTSLSPWVVSCATGTKCTAVHNSLQQQAQQEKEKGEYYDYSACILHDSHAEVLCRRGLVCVLAKEIQRKQQQQQQRRRRTQQQQDLLEIIDSGATTTNCCFRLRRGVQLHLYVSDSPCGDASIYSISDEYNNNNNNDNNDSNNNAKNHIHNNKSTTTTTTFTGAKVIMLQGGAGDTITPAVMPLTDSHDNDDDNGGGGGGCGKQQQAAAGIYQSLQPLSTTSSNPTSSSGGIADTSTSSLGLVAREPTTQLLAMLRTKSGRSNLQASRRSTSMSCSDKILRWAVLGLQGAVLSSLTPHPIRLASCIVSRDPRTTTRTSSTAATETATSANPNSSSSRDKNSQLNALQRAIPDRVASVHVSLLQLCKEFDARGGRGGGGGGEETSNSSSCSSSISNEDTHNIRSCSNNVTIKEFAKHLSTSFPAVFVVNSIFPRGKAVMELEKQKSSSSNIPSTGSGSMNNTRKRKHGNDQPSPQPPSPADATAKKSASSFSSSPTGLCINWNCAAEDQDVGLTVGARGTRHGKKPKTSRDYSLLESRLCRNQIRLLLSNLSSTSTSSHMISTTLPSMQQSQQQQHQQAQNSALHDDDDDAQSTLSSMSCYKTWKRSLVSPSHYHTRQQIFQQGPLKGWLVGGEPIFVTAESIHKGCPQQQQQQEQKPPQQDEEK